MKAGIGALPHDDQSWAFEIKWDGYRTLAHIGGGGVRLQSSNSLDVTAKYPELAGLPSAVNAESAILDGELVVLDDSGKPSFELMQHHGRRQAAFYAFDVLRIGTDDTVTLPYEQRRSLLEAVVEPGPNWLVPRHQVGDGAALLAVIEAQGMEGVMAKRLGSRYEPGKRSPNWRKVKVRRAVSLVVGGFTAGTGNRSSTFGSLLVGLPADDRTSSGALTFAGGVGTGFDQRTLEQLTTILRALRTEPCPFAQHPALKPLWRSATWVQPALVIDAEIAEFTNDGLVRHASFVGIAAS